MTRPKGTADHSSLEALANEFDGDLVSYLRRLRSDAGQVAIFSRVAEDVEGGGFLAITELAYEGATSPLLEAVSRWPKDKIDELFDLMPQKGALFGKSALVRKPFDAFPWINDSEVNSFVVQRWPIEAPFHKAQWYVFFVACDKERATPLRNPDEAVLGAYCQRIREYYHHLAEAVHDCSMNGLPGHTFASLRTALAGAGDLGWPLPDFLVKDLPNDEIADVVQRWAEEHEAPDHPFLFTGRLVLTPRQIAEHVRKRTRVGAKLRQHIAEYGFRRSKADQ